MNSLGWRDCVKRKTGEEEGWEEGAVTYNTTQL